MKNSQLLREKGISEMNALVMKVPIKLAEWL